MKKLISILGALALVTGATSTIVACGTQNFSKQADVESINNKNNLEQFAFETSKSLILNAEKGIDANYLYDNFTSTKKVKNIKDFDVSEQGIIQEFSRLNEWTQRYFDGNVLDKNKLSTNLDLTVTKKPVADSGSLIETILGLEPFIQMFAKGDIFNGLIGIISHSQIIQAFLTDDLKDLLANFDIPSQIFKTLEDLEYAFSDMNYEGYSYQQVLDASIIELSNGMKNIFGIQKDDITVDNEVANRDLATENISNLITDGIDGKLDLNNINILKNIKGVSQVIKSVRGIVAYINKFDIDTAFKPADATHIFSTEKTNDQFVDEIRNQKFVKEDNLIDLKMTMNNLGSFFITDDKGYNLQRLFSMLLGGIASEQTNNKDTNTKKSMGIRILLNKIISNFIKQMDGIGNFEFILSGFIDTFLYPIFTNQDSIEKFLKAIQPLAGLISGFIPNLKEAINLLLSDKHKDFVSNLYKFLYSGDIATELKDVTDLLGFDLSSFAGFNIKSVLEKPLIGGKSISKIFEEINANLNSNNEEATTKEATTQKLDLSDIANLLGSFRKKITWTNSQGQQVTTTVIEKALQNTDNIFEILGYNSENKEFNQGSPLEYINNIISKDKVISQIFAILKVFKTETETSSVNSEIMQIIKEDFLTDSKWEKKDVIPTITDGIVQGIKVVTLFNGKQYEISVQRSSNGFFTIQSFNKI